MYSGRSEFGSKSCRYADDSMFGRGIGNRGRPREQAGRRGCIHDMSEALFRHDPVGGAKAMHHPQQVDIYAPLPVGKGEIGESSVYGYAGIVEHVIQTPVLFKGILQNRVHRLTVGYVQSNRGGRPAGALYLPGCLLSHLENRKSAPRIYSTRSAQ